MHTYIYVYIDVALLRDTAACRSLLYSMRAHNKQPSVVWCCGAFLLLCCGAFLLGAFLLVQLRASWLGRLYKEKGRPLKSAGEALLSLGLFIAGEALLSAERGNCSGLLVVLLSSVVFRLMCSVVFCCCSVVVSDSLVLHRVRPKQPSRLMGPRALC